MHSFVSCHLHVVFSTKERRPLITDELQERLWPYLGGIARENEMRAIKVGGVADHVHVLLSLPSTLAIAKAVQLHQRKLFEVDSRHVPRTQSVRLARGIRSLQHRCFWDRRHRSLHRESGRTPSQEVIQ